MSSSGIGLGKAQGGAFVGAPLDVRVQLDGAQDIGSACVDAEVFYGETLVDSSRVAVSIEFASPGSPKGNSVRVQSAVLVNEPIVSLNVRAGCQQKTSRRYTFFADVATQRVEPAALAQTTREAPDVQLPAVVAPAPASSSEGPKANSPAAPAPNRAQAARKAKAGTTRAAAPASVPIATPTAATEGAPKVAVRSSVSRPSGKSRLKLDPLDLVIERDPVLRASYELLTLPQENAQARADAAALWRALNASPEDILREAAQAQALEKDLKALVAVTADNQKGLTELAERVRQAESERYANALVYALIALCLGSLGALLVVWRRWRAVRSTSWLQGLDAGDSVLAAQFVQPPAVSPAPGPTPQVTAKASAQPKLTEVDVDLDMFSGPSHAPAAAGAVPADSSAAGHLAPAVPSMVARQAPVGVRDFSESITSGLRAIDSEELVDVRQQARFFTSLGEHQRAIDILTTRVAQCGESSPLVCLDLLKIYHTLGRESEFEFMRSEFNNWFTGRVPAFSGFGDEGRSLEHYPQVIGKIVKLWPTVQVLEYIENSIYHHSSDFDAIDFDLSAYRDLLLLHGVAKRIVRMTDDVGDSHASELVRIPARAQTVVLGDTAVEMLSSDSVVHRAGSQHRGAWKRSANTVMDPYPQEKLVAWSPASGAMKVPPAPVVAPDQAPKADTDAKPDNSTDFNFLGLR